MPFKLVYFLFIVLCFGLFAGFNLNNTSDVSLIFHTLKDIPIYISNLFSFLVGIVIILPFFAGHGKKKKEKREKKLAQQEAYGVKTVDLKPTKKKRFWQKKDKKEESATNSTSTYSGNSEEKK